MTDLECMEQDMRLLVSGICDPCLMCAHCCTDGKPMYRPKEEYMRYCNRCDEDCSEFEWRGKAHDNN